LALSPDVIVRLVEADSRGFIALTSALDAELEVRYPGLGDDDTPAAPDLLGAIVAYLGEIPVGCGALREIEPRVVEIKRMFVVPDARRLGVASLILDALESRALALGYSNARLGTGVRQPEALKLYESCGYRRAPSFGEYEGTDLCVCYEKTLG
jgi:putative acetyltransferase